MIILHLPMKVLLTFNSLELIKQVYIKSTNIDKSFPGDRYVSDTKKNFWSKLLVVQKNLKELYSSVINIILK